MLKLKSENIKIVGTVVFVFLMPSFVFAKGLVPCEIDCGFPQLIQLIQNIINFLMFDVAAPLAAVVFAWAGILMLTAAVNPEKIKQATEIFRWVIIGVIVALSGWLIVSMIMGALLNAEMASFLKQNFLNF